MSKRRTAAFITAALTAPALAFGIGAAATATASAPAAVKAANKQDARIVAINGVTTLQLDPATAGVLTTNNVAVAPASEARAGAAGIAFPIQGGIIDPATVGGTVIHTGGLTFTAGGKSLTVRGFIINTRAGKLTAYVDEARTRIELLDLDLSAAQIAAGKTTLGVANVKATLTGAAAGALNNYFGVNLFAGGLSIGTANVSAKQVTLFE